MNHDGPRLEANFKEAEYSKENFVLTYIYDGQKMS